MLRLVPSPAGPVRVSRPLLKRIASPALTSVAALALAACSADVSRFDKSLFGSSSNAGASTIADSDPGPANLTDQTPPTNFGGSQIATRTERVSTGSLPPAPRAPQPYTKLNPSPAAASDKDRSIGLASREAPKQKPVRVADASPFTPESTYSNFNQSSDLAAGSGGQITVQAGDTLYGLSRRHRVSVAALRSANNLTGNIIRPGQTLSLPGPGDSFAAERSPVSEPRTPRFAAEPRAPRVVDTTSETHTIRRGDSLYRISRAYGIKVADLQAMNPAVDARRLRPGQVLRLRGTPVAEQPQQTFARRTPEPAATSPTFAPTTPPTTTVATRPVTPTVINTRPSPSTLSDAAPSEPAVGRQYARATPPEAADTGKFRWPARGRIISGFGPRKNGSHNDGIDIAVPKGTEIHAAEAGTIAYADSELKAYGNLVLIRHDNGWVSAYAHADRILVKRGDRVSRGQVIATAGATGNADQPMVHFELRDGAKPVNPRPLLSR
ncbi:MAG: peptidoglycan DD-metalloendopeptidase family protein [Pseudomonadota bacterium]